VVAFILMYLEDSEPVGAEGFETEAEAAARAKTPPGDWDVYLVRPNTGGATLLRARGDGLRERTHG
jgi:hypothetical protein